MGVVWQLQGQAAAIVQLGTNQLQSTPLVNFERELFPWRAQPFAEALADAAVDVGKDQLVSMPPGPAGTKVHLVGAVGGGFEKQCLRIGEEDVSFYSELAPQLSTFLDDYIDAHEGEYGYSCDDASMPDVQLWDLYGYVETGDCFGAQTFGDAGADRQLWLVEAYPVGISDEERQTMKADLAAR